MTVECTPYNVVTQDIDYTLVDPNARAFQQFYEAISTGADWDPDLPMFLHDPTKKILHRNTNGIGRTIFTLPYNDRLHEIEVLPQTAKLGLKVLNSSRKAPLSGSGSGKHIELGSIKGTIVALGKHYGKPAMKIQASSLGKQVWCCLSDE